MDLICGKSTFKPIRRNKIIGLIELIIQYSDLLHKLKFGYK